MSDLKNISGAERYSWAALIVSSVVGFHFLDRMTDGFKIIGQSAGDLMSIYLRIIIMFISLHIVVGIIFAAKRGKHAEDGDPYERDERDIVIERRGDRTAFWILIAAVEVVIFMLLFENMYPEKYAPPISVLSPSGMFFALMGAVLAADIVKRITMIMAYRA